MDLSKEGFKAWLTAQGDGPAGLTNHVRDCAFSRFLQSQGCDMTFVDSSLIAASKPNGEEIYQPPPAWLSQFIQTFDYEGVKAEGSRGQRHAATGNFALRCLFMVEEALEKQVYEPAQRAMQKMKMNHVFLNEIDMIQKIEMAWKNVGISSYASETS